MLKDNYIGTITQKTEIKLTKKFKWLFSRIIPVIIFFAIWEIISRLELVNPLLFPAPSIVWSALLEWLKSGELLRDLMESYWRMIAGFVIGGFIGVGVGILTGRIRFINMALTPIIQLLRPLPPVALIPLVIVWLGIGNSAKIFSISFAVFFPVWINTHLGATSIPKIYLWSARILCHSRLKIVFTILIPATLPYIISGLRNAIALSFIMVYVTEIAGASSGIGYQISVSHLAYRIDKMVAALFVLGAAGALVDFLFSKIIGLIFPWTYSELKK